MKGRVLRMLPAPEVLFGEGYGKEIDLWAIGVILYILWAQFHRVADTKAWVDTHPFKMVLMKMMWVNCTIKSWKLTMNLMMNIGVEFRLKVLFVPRAALTFPAKDLVSKLLVVDCKQRYTPEQVLNHPWIRVGLHVCVHYLNFKEQCPISRWHWFSSLDEILQHQEKAKDNCLISI